MATSTTTIGWGIAIVSVSLATAIVGGVLMKRKLATDRAIVASANASLSAETERHRVIAAPTPAELVMRSKTSAEAIKMSEFKDGDGGRDSAIMFALWANTKMRLSDLAIPEAERTTYRKVMRDGAAERGKCLCDVMHVLQIRKFDDAQLHFGTMVDQKGDPHSFIAFRDVGDTFKGTSIIFCGFVVGRDTWTSTKNTEVQGVRVVGMFMTPKLELEQLREIETDLRADLKRRGVAVPSANTARP